MHYNTGTLSNGLRIIHLQSDSEVAYCGVSIRAGARDETPEEEGLAHFVEHLLFKGTRKRRPWHILNRMEVVGGELNAYTAKEETFVYSIFLNGDFARAAELIADIVSDAQFPEQELDKERQVILDEISMYRDNPAELIFDEFENLLFKGNSLGHYILGTGKTLKSFKRPTCASFRDRCYTADNMVFFSMSKTGFDRVLRTAERYFSSIKTRTSLNGHTRPDVCQTFHETRKKKTHQSHIVMGGASYNIFDARHPALFLMNDILGGPGMNSRLNVSLRERNGLVYNIESNVTAYTDTGVFTISFGTDPKHRDDAITLIDSELKKIRNERLNDTRLKAAKKQAIGQIGVSGDNREMLFLGMGKSFLHRNTYDTLTETCRKIEAVTASQLQDVANEILAPEKIATLIYE